MNGAAALITSITGLITAIGIIISILINGRRIKVVDTKIDDVHTEIKTANGLSLAELADDTETRRIVKKPKIQRTKEEKTHLREVPK